MRLAKTMMAVAAMSLATAPALANSASKLSLSNASSVRASSAAGESNEAAGGFLIPLLAVAAVVLGVVVAVDNDESDSN